MALALVLFGGAMLRAHDVGGALVWHDEVFTQVFAAGKGGDDWLPLFDGAVRPVEALRRARRRDPDRGVLDTAVGLARSEPQHPPLYYMAARAFGGLLDGSDVTAAAEALRWLSVLGSLLGLAAAWWAARELFEHRRRRLAAVALFALSPFHVLYAQEAREYALWTALVLASTAALLRARRRATVVPYAVYGVLLALGFYVSLATAAVALGHGLFVLARDTGEGEEGAKRFGAAAGGWAFALVLFAPWAALVLRHWEAYRASMAWARTIVVPRTQLGETFGLNLTRAFAELGADSLLGPAGLVLAVALALAAAGYRALADRPDARLVLAGLVVGPVLLLLVPDLAFGGIRSVSARYLVPTLVGMQFLVAAAVPGGRSRPDVSASPKPSEAPSSGARLRRAGVAALVLLGAGSALWASSLRIPWTKGISRGLPEVAEALRSQPGGLLVGDHERHHPGTLLTLSGMVNDDLVVQLLGTVEGYALPPHVGPLFFLDPNPRFRAALQRSAGVSWTLVVDDPHAPLWRARRRGQAP